MELRSTSATEPLFDVRDPFPLLAENSLTYAQAQCHSAQVDEWLGLRSVTAEHFGAHKYDHASDDVQVWHGLPVQAMQTPYSEIRFILNLLNLKSGDTIVDLGCGYGRMALVLGRHHPDCHFIGYEIVQERVLEGQRILRRFDPTNSELRIQDLSDPIFRPAPAQYYFIFDFGSHSALEKTLQDLRQLARSQKVTLVARGRGIRHKIYREHPWLCQVQTPSTYDTFTIFRS